MRENHQAEKKRQAGEKAAGEKASGREDKREISQAGERGRERETRRRET